MEFYNPWVVKTINPQEFVRKSGWGLRWGYPMLPLLQLRGDWRFLRKNINGPQAQNPPVQGEYTPPKSTHTATDGIGFKTTITFNNS